MTTTDTDLLVTREGVRLYVRPACGGDEPLLVAFFARVTSKDLRFRFLTGVRQVGHERLVAMVRAHDDRTESLIAFADDGTVVAAAMLAGDRNGECAEAAIAIHGDMKRRGIGWTLLDHPLGKIGTNPARGVRKLAGTPRERRLSRSEIAKLGSAMRAAEESGEHPTGLVAIRFPDTKSGAQTRVIGRLGSFSHRSRKLLHPTSSPPIGIMGISSASSACWVGFARASN